MELPLHQQPVLRDQAILEQTAAERSLQLGRKEVHPPATPTCSDYASIRHATRQQEGHTSQHSPAITNSQETTWSTLQLWEGSLYGTSSGNLGNATCAFRSSSCTLSNAQTTYLAVSALRFASCDNNCRAGIHLEPPIPGGSTHPRSFPFSQPKHSQSTRSPDEKANSSISLPLLLLIDAHQIVVKIRKTHQRGEASSPSPGN